MKARLTILTAMALAVLSAPLRGDDGAKLPEKYRTVLDKLVEFEAETRLKADKVILEKRKEIVGYLEGVLPTVMKSGDLDGANAVNEAIQALKVEIAKLERSVTKEEDAERAAEVEKATTAEFQALKKRVGLYSRADGKNSVFRYSLDGQVQFETKYDGLHVLVLKPDGKIHKQEVFPLEWKPDLRPSLVAYVEAIEDKTLVVLGVCGTTRDGSYKDVIEMIGGETTYISYVDPFFCFGVRGRPLGAVEAKGGKEVREVQFGTQPGAPAEGVQEQ